MSKKQVCKLCLNFRWLTEDNRPADGINRKFLNSNHVLNVIKIVNYFLNEYGVKPYVRYSEKE